MPQHSAPKESKETTEKSRTGIPTAATTSSSDNPGNISTSSGLRQRFKDAAQNFENGAVEEMSVKIKKNDAGHFKVIAPGTPFNELDLSQSPLHHHHHHTVKKTWVQWLVGRKFMFPIAFLLGAVCVLSVMRTDMQSELSELWPTLQQGSLDVSEFLSNMNVVNTAKKVIENRDFTVGEQLLEQHGLHKEHPIILIPGIVSTGLESWSTNTMARSIWRGRLWGTTTMIRTVVTDKERWQDSLAIDLETGLDPTGYKVRAAQGLDAASEFIQGYWIWQKIVQNLAVIGYDTNSMDMAAYDWRLAYYNLEIRDFYFSRLKSRIELLRKHNGKKVVLASHSMGGTLTLYFLKWVESEPDGHSFGGGGGPQWVEDNIEAWINVAGTLLGVPKAMTAFLSGEMRDTVELHPLGSYVLEKFFSRKERARLFRNWPGSSSMWMKGGNRIWGNETSAPDDPAGATDTYGRFFSFRHPEIKPEDSKLTSRTVSPNLTVDDASPYVLTHTPPEFQRMLESNFSHGFESDPKRLAANGYDHTKWSNPLEVQLPNAPSMKIFCLYGHGKETERSYWYVQGEYEQDETRADAVDAEATCDPDEASCERPKLDFPLARALRIDNDVTVKGSLPEVRSGVKFADGDGTISTISLGSMCVRGWKGKTPWNPAGIKVVTQEYKHSPESLDLRGGALTADHVDILGSSPLNAAIVKIAAGRSDLVEEQIGSDILTYVDKIQWE